MVLNYNSIKLYKAQILRMATLVLFVIVAWTLSQDSPKCNFVLLDMKEYKGQYKSTYSWNDGSYYIVYEGLIKNNSDKDQYLKGMIAKVYNQDNVLVSEGYTEVNNWIKQNTAIPIKINTQADTIHDTVLRKYFDINSNFKADIYPWFSTCK